MLHDITTLQDVETFLEQIAQEIDDFHPMLDFTSYLYPDSFMQRYTEEEAVVRNKQLDQCLDILATVTDDFYTILVKAFELAASARESALCE